MVENFLVRNPGGRSVFSAAGNRRMPWMLASAGARLGRLAILLPYWTFDEPGVVGVANRRRQVTERWRVGSDPFGKRTALVLVPIGQSYADSYSVIPGRG
jgi:hypothetical protein